DILEWDVFASALPAANARMVVVRNMGASLRMVVSWFGLDRRVDEVWTPVCNPRATRWPELATLVLRMRVNLLRHAHKKMPSRNRDGIVGRREARLSRERRVASRERRRDPVIGHLRGAIDVRARSDAVEQL